MASHAYSTHAPENGAHHRTRRLTGGCIVGADEKHVGGAHVRQPETSPAFDIIFDMENDVRTVTELSNGIVLMLSGVGRFALDKEMEKNAALRVAYILRDHAASIQDAWEKAFTAMGGQA